MHDYFILNLHVPMKKNIIRGNNAPFMNKTLSQAFMHRSKLRNRYNKNPIEQNRISYNQQRNYCVTLLKKEKRRYGNNLDLKIFKDDKAKSQTTFSDKQKGLQPDIIIVENNITTSDKKEVAEKLNNYFFAAVDNLDIESYLPGNMNDLSTRDIILIYENHPRIKKSKKM